jgi:hypothetical protein
MTNDVVALVRKLVEASFGKELKNAVWDSLDTGEFTINYIDLNDQAVQSVVTFWDECKNAYDSITENNITLEVDRYEARDSVDMTVIVEIGYVSPTEFQQKMETTNAVIPSYDESKQTSSVNEIARFLFFACTYRTWYRLHHKSNGSLN